MPDDSLADFISGAEPTAETQPDSPPEPHGGDAAGAPSAPQTYWADSFYFSATSPLSEYDTSFADAFAGTHESVPNGEAIVLVGNSKMPFRLDAAASLRNADPSNMLPVLGVGAVRHPKTKQPAPAICYMRPKGNQLVEYTDIPFPPMRDDHIIHDVITPVIAALSVFKQRRIFHGRINPANMIRKVGPSGEVVLGDCVAGPPGYDQALSFDTIERCMAEQAGKGVGTNADDLYALGVSIVVLCLGVDPMAQIPPEAIIEQKLDRGSYSALVGQNRLPPKLLEPVRGLLSDDAAARWEIEDVELWLSGRRLSPKQATLPQRAARPLKVGRKQYQNIRTLAHGMTSDVPAAAEAIDSDELNNWLRRTIGNEQLADDVETMASTSLSRAFRDERRIACVAMVLDGDGPIRYRKRAFFPDGIGWGLAEAINDDKPLNDVADFIESGLVVTWYQASLVEGVDRSGRARLYEQVRGNLLDTSLGFGLERCVYDLSPDLPCQSPLLDEHYVLELPELVTALDQIAARAERPPELIDRHIAAFILSRDPRLPLSPFRDLSESSDPAARGMAFLNLLATLQASTGIASVPNLAGWMISQLEPLLDSFNSTRLRQTLKDKLLECAQQGNLGKMLKETRDPKILAGDKSAFRSAQREYWFNEELAKRKTRELQNSRGKAEEIGHQYSAVVAGLLAVIAMASIALQRMS